MAPDLNAVAAGGKWDYDAPGSTGYNIPDITLKDPATRRMRVVCIGGGVSGLMIAYQLGKYCKNYDLQIFEKNSDIGGTWFENRYPGCACDIPSHAYTFNFALNPDWPRYFSLSPDIWAYLDKVAKTFNLRKNMTFDAEVIGCWWQEDKGEWLVKVRKSEVLPNGEKQEKEIIEARCDLLLHASGILNNFKWPDIEGIDKFKGKVVHTARWPKDYQSEEWKNDRVAVIGSGASSIQTVPNMQPHVKHMDIFVRTGVWFIEIAGQAGDNSPYSEEQKEEFKKEPSKLVEHSKWIENQVNGLWGIFYSDHPGQQQAKEMFGKRMAEKIKDKRLLEGFTPNFGVGCRRVTPGDPYMRAIQEDNVDVHFTPVTKLTEDGIVGKDGVERKVDTVVCATGFDVSYRPRFPIVGKGGIDLAEKWKVIPEGYLGLGVPDMPNFITFIGPTWPVENGSVMGPLLSVSEYMIQIFKKMQTEDIKSWAPRQDVTDAFNEHSQEWIKHTIWKDDCRAWYRNNETGRVNAVWPGSSLHYQHVIRHPRYEDFDIQYRNKSNMWSFLGMGWSAESRVNMELMGESAALAQEGIEGNKDLDEAEKEAKLKSIEARKKDVSPYINTRYLDPRWLEANGHSKEEAKEMVIKATAEKAAARVREELERAERGEGGDAATTTGFDATIL